MLTNPVAMAENRMPNMWKLWKWNISWMRYQEAASDFTRTKPNITPTRR
jgi:hypothetical protein